MIAGTCGVIGRLIDIFLVGAPGKGKLTRLADNAVNSTLEKFASAFGWKGRSEVSDPTKSAIGFLERKFKVNYDHRHGGDVDGQFRMIQFLLRTNLVGWARFGTLAIKELHAWYKTGGIDASAVDEYMDNELRRMLKTG